MYENDINFNIAELFLRCFLGILITFQGYDKLFIVKLKNVINTFKEDAVRKKVPYFVIIFTSYFTSITEFFGGILLILGIFHDLVPLFIALDLLIVGFAFSFLKPVWDLHHVFPRVILLASIKLLDKYFYFGIDTLIMK
jgi:putative oxidoreductase